MRPDPGDAGFTLLEVMVALVIAALGSIMLYEAGFNGASEATTAARYQEAVVRAQSRLASLGVVSALRPQQASGDDGGGFSWRLSVLPEKTIGTLTLFDVRLIEGFGNRQVVLATKRLGPSS